MQTLRIEKVEDGIAIAWLDVPDKAVNTLSPAMLDELEQELGGLLADGAVRGIVLASGKGKGFIAGADLEVLEGMRTADEAAELSRRGNALLSRLAGAAKPVVAAVHGAALGGGLEVALACHSIVASDDPATVLGLPEVMLGLLPAGGGTQRLPQRIGLTAALPMLLSGKRLRARRAKKVGLVDVLTTPGGIGYTAARLAARMADGGRRQGRARRGLLQRAVHRVVRTGPARRMVLKKAHEQVMRKTRGLYPAPLAILECVEVGLADGVDAGLAAEAQRFGELVVSPQARALVGMFLWQRQLERERGPAEPRPVRRLAILGGGFMGAGIASVSVGRYATVVRDLAPKALSGAARTVSDGLDKQVRSGAITAVERERRWSRLMLTTDVQALRGADLVIEAVFEDLELKRRVLAEAEEQISPEAVFATNTSALPVADIARDARHPERVLGMHYFSPVPKMPLLELVRAERTTDRAVETARAVGIAQGKTVIVVRDGPGFYTSRILAPYVNEAIVLLGEGARIEDVDDALLDFGFPVGPLALLDEVGIDVGAHVARDLGARFAERGAVPTDALQRMRDAGYEGRKNRRGFYAYPAPGRKGSKHPDPDVYRFFGGEDARREVPPAEIRDRLALLMVAEAVHCLQEGVIESARDGDVGAVFGLGFPPFRGGPFRWVDRRGPEDVVARCEQLAERHGPRFVPPERLAELAREGGRFHDGPPAW